MRNKLLLFCLFIWGTFNTLNAQEGKHSLRFRKDSTFKIVQFTDLHWNNTSPKRYKTLKTIKYVLDKEKPDFIIFTGDIIGGELVKDSWIAITKPILDANIPWSVTFGNHDEEQSMNKEDMWKFLQTLPNFIGEKGNVSGVGNNALCIYGSKNVEKIKSVVYLFDSHDYTENYLLGDYDWIKFDQINWYRNLSDKFTAANGGVKMPSLAFFHIPLPEYKEMSQNEILGNKYDGIASSDINSGLFSAMIEKKDVMGVFVGHDHDNNYIGILKNIALGFGQVTGEDAYGRMERGARVILLEEGRASFQSWIRTPSEKKFKFYYPSGLSEITKTTEVLEAKKYKLSKNGVRYKYYEGAVNNTADISKLKVKRSGVMSNFSISSSEQKDHFAFVFDTWIKIPHSGYYKFFTYSDDGSVIMIDGHKIVDNDGGHSPKRKEGIVALEKGFHKMQVLYFEDYMGEKLDVGMSSIHINEGAIPNDLLFIDLDFPPSL